MYAISLGTRRCRPVGLCRAFRVSLAGLLLSYLASPAFAQPDASAASQAPPLGRISATSDPLANEGAGVVARVAFLAGCQLLGTIFLFSGLSKAVDLTAAANALAQYRLVPALIGRPFMATLSLGELAIATNLIVQFRPTAVLWVAMTLLVVFCLAQVWLLTRGITAECGCFGSTFHSVVDRRKVVNNLALIGLCVGLLAMSRWYSQVEVLPLTLGMSTVYKILFSTAFAFGLSLQQGIHNHRALDAIV